MDKEGEKGKRKDKKVKTDSDQAGEWHFSSMLYYWLNITVHMNLNLISNHSTC